MPGRAHPDDQPRLLTDVLARARAAAPEGVVLFDLDSTILDNRPRQARILQDYGRETGLLQLLDARPDDWVGWDIEAALRRAGLSPEEAHAHARPARRFWADWFFTSAYCRLDVPIPGAPAFVDAVRRTGARVAYVTGRPVQMKDGTLHVFRRAGFPLPDAERVFLLMKDDADLSDDAWKVRACDEVARLGPVIAAFDNEPAHVNLYAERWPEARCVHMDRDHSSRPIEVLPRIPSILDFSLADAVTGEATETTPGAP